MDYEVPTFNYLLNLVQIEPTRPTKIVQNNLKNKLYD
jgi:hypothetical protein